jgi:outer membrane protein OmpA-like peptidoglycan-associated protein
MTNTAGTKTAGLLALGLALAACSPRTPGNEADPSAPANDQAAAEQPAMGLPDNAAMVNGADAAKSILRPEIAEAEPEIPVLAPFDETVAFGASDMALDDAARAQLVAILLRPSFKAGGPITLRGHTDSKGLDSANLRASRKRAELVRDYLVAKGVAAERMTVIGLGETRPIAPNAKPDGSDDPEGRAKNRRVDVSVALPPPPEPQPQAGASPAA